MKLSDAREAYYDHSGSASTVARQLGFAGIALVWIFRSPENASVVLPAALQAPAVLLIIGLGFDLMQYAASALIWGGFARHHERRHPNAKEAKAPAWLNWPGLVCFWTKIAAVISAYVLLLRFAAGGVSFG
jgi:hypothetical protein